MGNKNEEEEEEYKRVNDDKIGYQKPKIRNLIKENVRTKLKNEQVELTDVEKAVIKAELVRRDQDKIEQEKRELGLDRVNEYKGKYI